MSCTEVATGCHICAVEAAAPAMHAGGVADRLVIVFEVDEDGWVLTSIPAISGVHSQGRSHAEARANVTEALHGVLELRAGWPACRSGVVSR